MSESIVDRQEKIRAKFASFTDPDDKWKFLLDLAREHKGMDASLKAEKFIIQGCASTMYLVPKFVAHCGARLIGYKPGSNYKKLSKKMIWRCTSNRAYWRHHWDMTNIPADVHAGYGKNAEGL